MFPINRLLMMGRRFFIHKEENVYGTNDQHGSYGQKY